VRGDIFTS